MSIFKKPVPEAVIRLRDLILHSQHHGQLANIPDQLEELIRLYENSYVVHPHLREDVFTILSGSIELAFSLLSESYPIDRVNIQISNILACLRNVLIHSEKTRPSATGYGILFPSTTQLLPQIFRTKEEAQYSLDNLSNLGILNAGVVVPIRLSSDHAITPRQSQALSYLPHAAPPSAAAPREEEVDGDAPSEELRLPKAEPPPTQRPSAASPLQSREVKDKK